MANLLDLVLEAHGGLQRWQEARTIHAKGSIGGLLWTLRGRQGILATADMTLDVQRQRVVFEGFTGPELRGVFTPGRVTIERRDGEVVAERTSPGKPSPVMARTPPGTSSMCCTSRATPCGTTSRLPTC